MRNTSFAHKNAAALIFTCLSAVIFPGALLNAQTVGQKGLAGNRLNYLDEPCNPYYVGQSFPKLTTPQWYGQEGVEAVVIFAIDDMRDTRRYEEYLRPIIEKLKEIDGRGPVSIMTNQVDPADPQLQRWISEGLTIDIHTIDHPCPCLKDSRFDQSRKTYDDCVDLMFNIPGNQPTTFRMPCCDSLNTPSPRFWSEIFNRSTSNRNFLRADSSVFQLFTADDPDLPADLLREPDGASTFEKYVPFPSFANTIRNYPYPYVINNVCWEFPCTVPSDWQGQHLHQPNNPITVNDLKLALDLTVHKQGVMNVVFHPHGWIRNTQIMELIDHAIEVHGSKVKFLTFGEAMDRLSQNLLSGTPLRGRNGTENPNRLLDVNGDGYLDVVQSEPPITRVWVPATKAWNVTPTPFQIGPALSSSTPVSSIPSSSYVNRIERFGVTNQGRDVIVSSIPRDALKAQRQLYHFKNNRWVPMNQKAPGSKTDDSDQGQDLGASYPPAIAAGLFRDIDGDGQSEWLEQAGSDTFIHVLRDNQWVQTEISLPDQWRLLPANWQSTDSGVRLVDLNKDGSLDLVASDEKRFGAWLFDSLEKGWSIPLRSGERGREGGIPPIARNQTNNGAWFLKETLWIQNEDTAKLPDLVDRLRVDDLLSESSGNPKNVGLPQPLGAEEALRSIRLSSGLELQLVAAEPLIADPVAFDWGPDGRLWVAEMSDYPLGVNGQPGGRVRVLTDTDGDGRYDKSTIFADDLPFPTGVKVWRDSVIISTAPDILQAYDNDGDGKADEINPIFRGFAEGNQQHRVNGLRYGIDHRLYLANGDSGGTVTSVKTGKSMDIRGRDLWINPDTGAMATTSGQTQFGRNCDDWQNWFGGNNSNPMWHYVLDESYLSRNPHVSFPSLRNPVSIAPGTSPVFPLSETLERYNDFKMANRFTSACSPNIYRDQLLGKNFYGNAFICEPVHNLVHREVMEESGSSWMSERAADEQRSEFLASRDSWFRPVMIRTAPDGTIWIADMYRLVIEHPEWITPERQAELDLRSGHDRGRIYRVTNSEHRRQSIIQLDPMDAETLAKDFGSSNGWVRNMAQQMLIWNAHHHVAPLLQQMLREHKEATARLHCIATLKALEALTVDDLIVALRDKHPGVRRWAVKCSEDILQTDELRRGLDLAAKSEVHPAVLVQYGCSLGIGSADQSIETLAYLMEKHGSDPMIRASCTSSIRPETVTAIAKKICRQDTLIDPEMGRLIFETAAALMTAEQYGALIKHRLPNPADFSNNDPRAGQGWQALDAWRKRHASLPQALETWLNDASDWARKNIDGEAASVRVQRLAVDILRLQPKPGPSDIELILAKLSSTTPIPVRDYVVVVLKKMTSDDIAGGIIQRWREFTPATREQAVDLLLSRESWTDQFVQAIEGGMIRFESLGLSQLARLEQIPNKKLRERMQAVLSLQPKTQRTQLVSDYVKRMKGTGDQINGRILFEKHCASCHRLNGIGNPTGPDLAALTNKAAEVLVTAILDPNLAIEDKYLQYVALTHDGRQSAGVITEETSAAITLTDAEGKSEQIMRTDLAQLSTTGNSLMPEGFEKQISPDQLADIVSYLQLTLQPPKEFEGNTPTPTPQGDDGSFTLPAKHASIYGPQIIFEPHYQNLGWWSHSRDHAIWTIKVTKQGNFQVLLDYACAQGNHGGTFELSVGSSQLTGTVNSTGTWDDYILEEVGHITLTEGSHDLIVRPKGPINHPLIDLRTIKLVPSKE